MAEIVAALGAFNAHNAQGVPWQVSRGDLYSADDPIVTANPSMFGAPDVKTSESAPLRGPRTFAHAAETAVAPPTGATRAPVTNAGAKAKAAAGGGSRGPRDGEV